MDGAIGPLLQDASSATSRVTRPDDEKETTKLNEGDFSSMTAFSWAFPNGRPRRSHGRAPKTSTVKVLSRQGRSRQRARPHAAIAMAPASHSRAAPDPRCCIRDADWSQMVDPPRVYPHLTLKRSDNREVDGPGLEKLGSWRRSKSACEVWPATVTLLLASGRRQRLK